MDLVQGENDVGARHPSLVRCRGGRQDLQSSDGVVVIPSATRIARGAKLGPRSRGKEGSPPIGGSEGNRPVQERPADGVEDLGRQEDSQIRKAEGFDRVEEYVVEDGGGEVQQGQMPSRAPAGG